MEAFRQAGRSVVTRLPRKAVRSPGLLTIRGKKPGLDSFQGRSVKKL
jgi:hypothetical protein